MPRIVLEGVLKSFATPEGKTVLAADHLTLAVQDRELLVLVGPSGCGKTTTLRLIAGLEIVEAGQILFDDQPVTTLPPIDRDVAMVFQSHALFPHLTAFDNLAFGLKLRKLPKGEINSRVREMAELLGITHCLERKPGKLSGGERQRIALGRALVRRPGILLLDEPFSHLDEPLRVQLRTDLLALRSRLDMTVIYVTHDQAEALALGDRVAVMCQGRIQQIGTPREIYEAPANTFVAGFMGSPPMNLFHGKVAQHEGRLVLVHATAEPDSSSPAFVLPLGSWRADWFSQNIDRQIWLGIRPESVGLAHNDAKSDVVGAIKAIVQSTQYCGTGTILSCLVGKQTIVARTGAQVALHPGQTALLDLDLIQARLYDPATGRLLL
jgi:multiple sugar transport system ATP-binding protein